jgi:hypothetical protein
MREGWSLGSARRPSASMLTVANVAANQRRPGTHRQMRDPAGRRFRDKGATASEHFPPEHASQARDPAGADAGEMRRCGAYAHTAAVSESLQEKNPEEMGGGWPQGSKDLRAAPAEVMTPVTASIRCGSRSRRRTTGKRAVNLAPLADKSAKKDVDQRVEMGMVPRGGIEPPTP